MSKNGRNITDFFKPKPFTIPKNRIPRQNEDDEIIVASSNPSRETTRERTQSPAKKQTLISPRKRNQHAAPPVRRGQGRPRQDDPNSPSKQRLEPQRLEREREGSQQSTPTPTRRSPRKATPNLDGEYNAPPDSSGLTSLALEFKTTPTRERTLEPVKAPSQARQPSPMPVPTQMPAPEPRNGANTSFGSFSTLTSMSGMSSQSSSRRVIKNGVQAVTNSDSGSVSSSESEDELADFESFAPRKKLKLSPPVSANDAGRDAPSTSKPTRSSTRLGEEKVKQRAQDSWRELTPPPKRSYKHSLLNIAKRSARENASEKKIAETEAYMKEMERLQAEGQDGAMDMREGKNVAAALAADSEEEERMLMAMERTEALCGEETFHFFRGHMEERMDVEFPAQDLDAYGLGVLRDESKRRRACTSGFLSLVASQKGLPGPVVSWVQDQLLDEESDELCESYVSILGALATRQHSLSDPAFSLSETYTGHTFRDAEDTNKAQGDIPFPKNLKYSLKAMAALAPRIPPIDQACALAELILLNNDEEARSDFDLQLQIEQAMHAILETNNPEGLQTVFQETTRQILHASSISRHLLARAIATLPATTQNLHNLRRKLALHILLEAPPDADPDPTTPSTGVRLLVKLKKHPSYSISESTDYTALHSLTDLLDIAIDAGFSDFAFFSQQQAHAPVQQRTTLFSSAPAPQAPEEAAFNAQVDALVTQLRLMASKIRDAGTSHLKRTEAKSAIERLVVRLECAVRTRPKPRKGFFDRGGVASVGAGALDGFLKKSARAETPGRAVNGTGAARENSVSSAQGALGTQHKVTWREDVVGGGGGSSADATAGAAADEDDGSGGGSGDDEDENAHM